jgi:hypothetical protein
MKKNNVKFTKDKGGNIHKGQVLITPDLAKEILAKCSPGSTASKEERVELMERIIAMMITPSSN